MNSLTNKSLLKRISQNSYLLIFLLALCTAFAMFLPFLIYDHGMFIYYGDYNVQQIPFYQNIHDAVQSGNFAWNWTTDLGVNTVGSYTFYMLTSPFFWITLLFPSAAVPYLMAPLLMIKFGLIAVTGYAYIKRFTKSNNAAILGGLMYAFCGFNLYNVFFNHFHEAVMVFPLLLIALEEFLVNDRRGVFALAVALSAVINYYFFFGQAIFLVLYFFLRLPSKDFRLSFKRFLALFAEAVIGVLLSCVALLPSAIAAFGNSRLGSILSGMDLVVYNNSQRYGLIVSSFFFPPDIPARPNFFPESNAKWSSVSMYLPVISMTGVFAYFLSVKKSFKKWLLIICFGICLIPGFNALFSLLNYNYYARWFYMPILIMAAVSVIAMEKYSEKLKPALILTSVFTGLFMLIGIIPKKSGDTLEFFSLPEDPAKFWGYVCIAAIGIVCTMLFIAMRQRKNEMFKCAIALVCAMSVVTGVFMIACGKSADSYYANYDMVHNKALNGGDFNLLNNDSFYRIDTFDELDNLGMFWNMPTINAFHSIVPSSVVEYYESIGVDRGVGSRPAPANRGLRALLSVKYRFSGTGREYIPTDGFNMIGSENGFDVYENENYIKMGFTYDKIMSRSQYDEFSKEQRQEVLLKAICLEDKDYEKYKSLLLNITDVNEYSVFESYDDFSKACAALNATSATDFTYTNNSFTAKTTLANDNLVFFSVPYDSGWSVTVNGKAADVIKANVGFMAVYCEKGENTIEFHYKTPGLSAGIIITFIGALLLLIYLLTVRCLRKNGKMSAQTKKHQYYSDTIDEIGAHSAYIGSIAQNVNESITKDSPKGNDDTAE